MANRASDGRDRLPDLRRLVDDLIAYCGRLFEGRVEYERDDPANLMALGFASKQLDHLRSIKVLAGAGQDGDAAMVARTMVEGMVQLRWAFQDRPRGPELWFWFGAVMDWRQLNENDRGGVATDPEGRRRLEDVLVERGALYHSPETRRRIVADKPLPADPYRAKWYDIDFASMFAKVGEQELYDLVYRIGSERLHWNPRSLLRSLDRSDGGATVYLVQDAKSAFAAVFAGTVSMLRTLEVLDEHLDLGLNAELMGLVSDRLLK